jgi:predicted metalloprotease with PDZ domain
MPFKSQSLQRLHEQLRHEIFHLWIPNGLNLIGNYDWFYEGFALYQSLRMAVAVNRISFADMLDTLSRAYAIDNRKAERISLLDASKQRWNNANTDIYARGMLVAFLTDLTLLERSRGRQSVFDLLTDVHRRYNSRNETTDGNFAVLTAMKSYDGLEPVVARYISGKEKIDWESLLRDAGLETEGGGSSTKLKVVAKPSGRQKDLLDKLGYNNWRKLSRKQ